MPILLRAGRVADLAPGECHREKVRGRKLWVCLADGTVGVFGTRCVHTGQTEGAEPCLHYRSQVRGGFVYVALDPDPNEAPADIHLSDRDPQPTN